MFETKATKAQARARVALEGPAGSGKTMTGLEIATRLGNRVAVIDTEHGSASKYADKYDFWTESMSVFSPENYIKYLHGAEAGGFDVILIDSLSHVWEGKGGALEMKDAAAKGYGKNSFNAWADVTPKLRKFVEAILASPAHVIATLRTKTKWGQETDERGKTKPVKLGLAPIMKDGIDYEFDIVGRLDVDNNLTIIKSRCSALSGQTFHKPGEDVANIIKAWLSDGADLEKQLANLLEGLSASPDPIGWVRGNKAALTALPVDYRDRAKMAIDLAISAQKQGQINEQ